MHTLVKFMTILQALTLGIIQGITEFLPISSSGHLIFIPHIFGWGDQGLTFDVIVHLGSLIAVVVYFREVLFRIVRAFFSPKQQTIPPLAGIPSRGGTYNRQQQDRKMGWLLALSIVPALVVGLFFEVLGVELRSPVMVAFGLIFWGVVLGTADRYQKQSKNQEPRTITFKNALFIGCAQAIALIPGTSRSGITMTAGLFAKLTKKQAAEFSFLMSVPVIAIAGALKVVQFVKDGGEAIAFFPLIVGFFAAAVSGYVAIWGLMKIIEKWSFMPFVVYRIVVGLAILMFLV